MSLFCGVFLFSSQLNPSSTPVLYLFKTFLQSLSSHLMSFCDSCCRWFPFSLSCCVSLFLPCLPLPSVFPCSSPVFLILPLSPNKLHPLIFLCVVLYVCFHLLHSHHERRFGIEGRVGRHPNVSVSDESLSNGLRLTEVGSHHHFNSL